jgi:hypothetical protein
MSETPTQPPTTQEALDIIATEGDASHFLPWLRTMALPTATGLIAGTVLENINTLPDGGPILDTMIYGATFGVAATIGARLNERRKARMFLPVSEQAQDVWQRNFTQPMDVISDHGGTLRWRWYGFDKGYHAEGFVPSDNLAEFEQLVATARLHKVKGFGIVVSANILNQLDEEARQYPRLRHNVQNYVHKFINDHHADKELIGMTVEEAQIIADKIREKTLGDNVSELITFLQTTRPTHPVLQKYEDWQAEPKNPQLLKNLQTTLRNAIEDRQRSEVSIIKVTSDDGLTQQRFKARTQAQLRGSQLFTTSEAYVGTVQPVVRPEGSRELLDQLGSGTLDQLLADFEHTTAPSETKIAQVEAALWHLLGPEDLRQTSYYRLKRADPNLCQAIMPSLLTRLRQEPPTVRPVLRRYGKGHRQETASLHYERGVRLRQRIGVLALGAFCTVGFSGFAHSASEIANRHYEQAANQLAREGSNSKGVVPNSVVDHYLLRRHTPETISIWGMKKLSDINNTVEQSLSGSLGKIGVHLPGWGSLSSGGDQNAHNHGLYFSNGQSAFGDVGTPSHQAIWDIVSQGASTNGYWVQNTENALSVESSDQDSATAPFANFALNTLAPDFTNPSYIRLLPVRPSQPNKPSIDVTTPGNVSLSAILTPDNEPKTHHGEVSYSVDTPVLNGYKVVAASANLTLEPGKGTGTRTPQALTQVPVDSDIMADGTNELSVTAAGFPQSELTNVTPPNLSINLQYWLQPSQQPGTDAVRAITPPLVIAGKSGNRHPLNRVLSLQQASSVWASLRNHPDTPLPRSITATADAVRQAHQYNFNLVQAGGIKNNLTGGGDIDPSVVLTGIAKAYAKDKYGNCNTATLQELILTRGQDGNGYLNPTVGFYHNQDEGDSLTPAQSHMWLTTNQGAIIDATPLASSEQQPSSSAAGTALLLAGTLLAGTTYAGSAVRRRRRSKQLEQAKVALFPEDEAQRQEIVKHLELFKVIRYGSPANPWSIERVDAQAAKNSDSDLPKAYRIHGLKEPKAEILEPLATLQAQGHYRLGSQRAKDFKRFVKHLGLLTRYDKAYETPKRG